jgi:hypothetical protein
LVTISRSKVSAGIAVIVILVIVFIFSCTCPNLQAQTDVFFSPADKFSIPAYNGTISFAVNGSYSKATFENGSWTFMNLRLNGSQPLENFEISAQNSNVTIFSYLASNNTAFQSVRLRYVVEGQGKQILNLGRGSGEGEFEWSVAFNGHLLGEGDDWTISHNGTLVVTGATGNVSIVQYDYFDYSASSSNLPFYQQHSVAIITAMIVAITVIIAIVIKVKK